MESITDFYSAWLKFCTNCYKGSMGLMDPQESAKKSMDICEKNLKFFEMTFRSYPPPAWASKNEAVLDLKNSILRDFSENNSDYPVLILPPQAGHHSSIADFTEDQSLVRAFLSNGFDSVFCAEWKNANIGRKDETIDDFITATDKFVEKIGKKVTLVGLCQGGWQAAIYTSLFPEKVNSLVLAGAPIDFDGEDGLVNIYAKSLPLSFFENLVALGNGIMKGYFILMGFKNMQPIEQYFTNYLELYNNIDNDKFLQRYNKFYGWYHYTQDLPGKFYLQVVKDLFKENKLVQGELAILGKKVDLKKISCPLYLIAGDNDHITLKGQLFNIEKYASSKVIEKVNIPSGHIGLFMGKKALEGYWPAICKKINQLL